MLSQQQQHEHGSVNRQQAKATAVGLPSASALRGDGHLVHSSTYNASVHPDGSAVGYTSRASAGYPSAGAGPSAPAPFLPIGCDAPAYAQSSGALVRLCVPPGWRPRRDPLVLLVAEPRADDDANSAEARLRAAETRLRARLRGDLRAIPANWATAVTSLRGAGLPAIRMASADLADASLCFRRRFGPPSGVGLLGWGVGGLVATRALEASPPFGGACVACAPIGSTGWQVNYLLDVLTLFDVLFPGVLPPECGPDARRPVSCHPAPTLDPRDEARIVGLLNGHPDTALRLLREAGAAADLLGANSTALPVQAAMALLREAIAWRADQRAAFGGVVYDNVHTSWRTAAHSSLLAGGEGNVEDGALNKAADPFRTGPTLDPTLAPSAGAAATMRAYFETSGSLRSPLIALHPVGALLAPYWHQELYRRKAGAHGAAELHVVLTDDEGGEGGGGDGGGSEGGDARRSSSRSPSLPSELGECAVTPTLLRRALAQLDAKLQPQGSRPLRLRAEPPRLQPPTWDDEGWRVRAWGDHTGERDPTHTIVGAWSGRASSRR